MTIHTPLNDETRHMFGYQQFKLMKPTAVLVNTARGPIVNNAELARALQDELLAGAGLDVLEVEPPQTDDALLTMDNVQW